MDKYFQIHRECWSFIFIILLRINLKLIFAFSIKHYPFSTEIIVLNQALNLIINLSIMNLNSTFLKADNLFSTLQNLVFKESIFLKTWPFDLTKQYTWLSIYYVYFAD